MKFLMENAGKRSFFMMVSHYSVHVPHAASQKYMDKWQAKYDALEKPTDKEELRLFERECNSFMVLCWKKQISIRHHYGLSSKSG
ncbi:MAG: hypothetical protein CM15mP130_2060 [Verrucomicrobiota bacterium]|nr:MAG: hypothetical protein CM15mP130_2060 [Verrucomicrobiota bacterium]